MERWSPEDRAKVSAVALERAERCQRCGTSSHEWAEDPYAYEPMFVQCPGCQKEEELAKDDTPRPSGTTIRLIPKQTAERLRLEAALRPIERPRRRKG